MHRFHIILAAALVVFSTAAFAAAPHEAPIRDLVNSTIMSWLQDPLIIQTIKEQNSKHASLAQGDIDKLDKQWRAETKASNRPLVSAVLGNALSKRLKKIQDDSKGLYTEIFVMDNKGLNAGQSNMTSDYWQGDEAKWKKSFGAGPNGIFIDGVEEDESTQTLQSQVSVAIVDPDTKGVIGAVTIGINVETLME